MPISMNKALLESYLGPDLQNMLRLSYDNAKLKTND